MGGINIKSIALSDLTSYYLTSCSLWSRHTGMHFVFAKSKVHSDLRAFTYQFHLSGKVPLPPRSLIFIQTSDQMLPPQKDLSCHSSSLCPILFLFQHLLLSYYITFYLFIVCLHCHNIRSMKVYSFVQCCIPSKDLINSCWVNEIHIVNNLGLNVRKDLKLTRLAPYFYRISTLSQKNQRNQMA